MDRDAQPSSHPWALHPLSWARQDAGGPAQVRSLVLLSSPPAPQQEECPLTRIHTETAYFGGTIRLTMDLQGYAAPGAEFTLFTISPAKQQPPCSQNPGWTLI